MLNNFHVQHNIKVVNTVKFFNGAAAIINLKALCRSMLTGDGNVFRRNINAGDRRALFCHLFSQQASAAADVEDAKPCEISRIEMLLDFLCDKWRTQGIESVQRPHGSLWVPPLVGEAVKLFSFTMVFGCY